MSRPNALSRTAPLGCAVLLAALSGCAIPIVHPPASKTRDHAFIKYWPRPTDSTQLRLAVKDLIDMKGEVTTAGSEFRYRFDKPAKADATCLEIARQRGVHFVGKTNTSEIAVAVSGINEFFGTPRNPMSKRHLIPGGSSSGSAVAVANSEADVAFGTDTAGSIRLPAACCGIVGLKTTFGLVPLDGVYPIAPKRLDTVGPMAKDVANTVVGMDLLKAGFAGEYRAAVASRPSAQSIRVGRLYIRGTDPKVDRAVDDALNKTGFQIVQLSPEFGDAWRQAQADGATVAAVGAWLHNKDKLILPQISVRTRAVLTLGAAQWPTTYGPALRRQAAWKATLRETFDTVDFIALPTMQKLPPPIPWFNGLFSFEARVLALQNTQAVNFGACPPWPFPCLFRTTLCL